MNAMKPHPTAETDDIIAFLGTIPPEEYEQRRRLRTCRNAANLKASNTKSADVRALCWIINERVSEWIYHPAPVEALTPITTLCRRLLMICDQIEELEAALYG